MATRKRRPDDDRAEEDHQEDYDNVPLHRKQPFGAGLKRKKVEFVRAQESDVTATIAAEQKASGAAVGDFYASIVLGAKKKKDGPAKEDREEEKKKTEPEKICDVCALPIVSSVAEHNASLAHQVSIQHSHPPSHLDRSRMGLRTLNSQGWDPDARVGLGREGEGLRFPIKVVAKDDTLGIGAVVPEESKAAADKKEEEKREKKSLSAREMKAVRLREKEKAERLQQEIYGRVDVERYLRGG